MKRFLQLVLDVKYFGLYSYQINKLRHIEKIMKNLEELDHTEEEVPLTLLENINTLIYVLLLVCVGFFLFQWIGQKLGLINVNKKILFFILVVTSTSMIKDINSIKKDVKQSVKKLMISIRDYNAIEMDAYNALCDEEPDAIQMNKNGVIDVWIKKEVAALMEELKEDNYAYNYANQKFTKLLERLK